MAGSGMNILPQYQGDYYALQNKQALAQALMQQSLTPQPLPQAVGSGGSQNYQVMPKYSALSGAAELGKALLAAKMQQQAAQGLQGLGQNQMSFLMGGQQPAPVASGMGGAPDGTTASAGPAQADPQALAQALGASGGGSPPQGQAQPPQQAVPAQQQSPQQAQGGGLLAPGSPMNPSGMDQKTAAYQYLTLGPEKYSEQFVAPYVKPTAATLAARQGGLDVGAANRTQFGHDSYIAPVVASPNSTVISQTGGGSSTLPAAAPAGYQNIQSTDGKWYTIPVQGGTQAVAGSAAAATGGEGSQLPFSGVDNTGAPLPVTNRTAAATGGGIPPIPTLPTPPGMSAPSGNGSPPPLPPGGAIGPGQAAGNGRLYATPPLGATSNANAAQQASADSMKASYGKLQSINSTANGTLDSLQKMQALAANKNALLTAGTLGTAVAPIVSPDAAEYEKQRANVIQLLAAQNGTNGSNEGRSLTGESVPDYGKPKAAIQDGLQTQINQVRTQQLKANVLTPIYQSGDSKAYTTLENQFDQTVKPSVMPTLTPILQLSGPQQQAAVQAAVKANASLKPTFQLLFNAGMLK